MKFSNLFIVLISLLTGSISESAIIMQGSPPIRIGGTVTVDGIMLTQATDTGFKFVVSKDDDTNYEPAAQCETLNASDWYFIDIPLYHETMEPGGANPGDTAIIHVYKDETELIVTEPADGIITVGQSGSATQIDLVMYMPVPPAQIYGTITIDGSLLTQAKATAGGYSLAVTNQDGTHYTPQAVCNALGISNYYNIDIPIYHALIVPGGAETDDTAIIHVYKEGSELNVTSPTNGLFIVGQSNSITQMEITASFPTTYSIIPNGKASGSELSLSKGKFDSQSQCMDAPGNLPAHFPLGLFNFSITDINNGDDVTITFALNQNIPTNTRYYKYSNGTYVEYLNTSGLSDGDNQFSITLTDGGIGDDDGMINGHIIDPGGPGIPFSTKTIATSVPTLTEWGMLFFFCILIFTGIAYCRNQQNSIKKKRFMLTNKNRQPSNAKIF